MISLDLDAMVAAAHRLLAAHGLTVDGAGDNDRIISPAITSARDVLSLADALATAERERDAALASADLSARAAVDAARELGHVAAAAIARADAADARSTTLLMCGEAAERAAEEAHAQHAALAAAVRAYLAAVEAFDGGALGAPCRASIRVDDTRAALVAALERCP